MFTPVTANSQPREDFPWAFTLGQGGAARYQAAPTTRRVHPHRSLSPDHPTTLGGHTLHAGHTWVTTTEAPGELLTGADGKNHPNTAGWRFLTFWRNPGGQE